MQSYSKKMIWPPSTAQFPSTKIAAEHLKQTRSSKRWKLKDGSKRLRKAFFPTQWLFVVGYTYEPGSPSIASHTKSPTRKGVDSAVFCLV